jgi:hypothetical protein
MYIKYYKRGGVGIKTIAVEAKCGGFLKQEKTTEGGEKGG